MRFGTEKVMDLKTTDDAYELLAQAIVRQAAQDLREALKRYRLARKGQNPDGTRMRLCRGTESEKRSVRKCEMFFRSGWFSTLSGGMDGEYIIETMKKLEGVYDI